MKNDADCPNGCPEILILEPKSAPQHIWPPGWQFGPRSVNIFFPRPCRRLDRWDTQAIRLGSAFLAGALVFCEKHDLEKVVRLGSAFLAGAFVFWKKHDLENAVRLGSAFLAGAFVFWEKHDLEKSCPSRISVPSRGFCFLGKHDLEILERQVQEQCTLGKLLLLGGLTPSHPEKTSCCWGG